MAKMWAGRFQKETDAVVNDFNSSVLFDCRMYAEDIQGSIAHATMLGKQGIISPEDTVKIVEGLRDILSDIEAGNIHFSPELYEDIHMANEQLLTERIGDAGKRLHTARSRNDQVATDLRLYCKDSIVSLCGLLRTLINTLLDIANNNVQFIMPGYTHLQKAQPVSVAQYINAYSEMFLRDLERFTDCYKRTDVMPLGSGALAGTDFPIDRRLTASLLSFSEISQNSIDAVSDRDFVAEYIFCCATVMMHLSRFSEDLILFSSDEFRFIEIADSYATGSSIMPQKKNPDVTELIRGKTGRVYGALTTMLTVLKGLPLAYNKDMQEDKELTFDAFDTVKGCLALFTGMLDTMKFNKAVMEESAKKGFTNATDAADYLVNHGVPFRDAHGIIGRLVLYCIEQNKAIEELSLEELKTISPVFENDIYEAVSMETCVNKRLTLGAPGKAAMEQVIALNEKWMEEHPALEEK